MIEFTAARDYGGRQDRRIEYREAVKMEGSSFDVSVQDVYLGSAPVRLYLSGDTIFSGMYLDRNRRDELVFDYTAAYDRMFHGADVRNVLMIGGAACTYPRHCLRKHPNVSVTVVDADPCAEEIARGFFFLDEFMEDMEQEGRGGCLRLVTGDGRAFLDESDEKYDAILNDAFVGAEPVWSLATVEAARRIRRCLTAGGVYMTNVLASVTGRTGRFLRGEVKTLREVFRHVSLFPAAPGTTADEVANWMLMASDADRLLPSETEVRLGKGDSVLTDAEVPDAVLRAGKAAI